MRVTFNFNIRQILNFLITGFVFWASARLFPDNVYVDGLGSLVLVTLLFYIIQTLFALICMGAIILRIMVNNSYTTARLILVAVIAEVFLTCTGAAALMLLSARLEGFWISGINVAIMLSLAISILTTSAPKNKS